MVAKCKEGNSTPAPGTKYGIRSAIAGVLSQHVLAVDRKRVGDLVWGWRSEWLSSAEPRLRPVSEKPRVGDVVCEVYPGALGCENSFATPLRWRGDCHFAGDCIGWVLLERAEPKALAEEARELLWAPVNVFDSAEASAFVANAKSILRRIAEQEKSDEC